MSIRVQMDVEEVVSVRQSKSGSVYVTFKSNGASFQTVLGSSLLIEPHHRGVMNIVGESKILVVPGFNGGPARPQSFIQPVQIVGWIDKGLVKTDFDNFFQSIPITTPSLSSGVSSEHKYTQSDAEFPNSSSLNMKDAKK